ncbi:MAG TPA: hypothetical protein ENN41_10185 [Sediminispirochaeta sp.]|nr:hypothetical protein [Sediminispirochaeta sp.]
MKENTPENLKYIFGVVGSILIMLGTIFPSAFAIGLQPKQPLWESAAVFVHHYHVIQSLPKSCSF